MDVRAGLPARPEGGGAGGGGGVDAATMPVMPPACIPPPPTQGPRQNTELSGDDHAPVTRGRMRTQYPLPHGPPRAAALMCRLPPPLAEVGLAAQASGIAAVPWAGLTGRSTSSFGAPMRWLWWRLSDSSSAPRQTTMRRHMRQVRSAASLRKPVVGTRPSSGASRARYSASPGR